MITLGILFEVWFIWFFLIKAKNIKSKKVKLFIGILLSYVIAFGVSNISFEYHIYFYMILALLPYFCLKKLYNNYANMIDIFLIMYIVFMVIFVSIMSIYFLNSTPMALFVNRGVLTAIVLLSRFVPIDKWYSKYCHFWNRRDDGKMKALTVRNISLLFLNLALMVTQLLIVKFFIG